MALDLVSGYDPTSDSSFTWLVAAAGQTVHVGVKLAVGNVAFDQLHGMRTRAKQLLVLRLDGRLHRCGWMAAYTAAAESGRRCSPT